MGLKYTQLHWLFAVANVLKNRIKISDSIKITKILNFMGEIFPHQKKSLIRIPQLFCRQSLFHENMVHHDKERVGIG
jgi:hypothetical protein